MKQPTMKMGRLRPLLLAAALVLPTLAGCSRKEPDAPVAEGEANDEAPAPVAAPVLPEPEPAPAPSASPTADTPAEAAVAPDEQMMDDAAATGMTARSERTEEEPANTASVAEPTDPVETK